VTESISACLVNGIYNFIQQARTAASRETAIANSQCDFSHKIIRHRVVSDHHSINDQGFDYGLEVCISDTEPSWVRALN